MSIAIIFIISIATLQTGFNDRQFRFDAKYVHSNEELTANYDNLLDNNQRCKRSTKLLIVIKSSAGNFEKRSAIRESWLQNISKFNNEYVFVVGNPSSSTIRNRIYQESAINNDLLMGSFHEDYFNLTLKMLFTFNHTINYCPNQWLFSIDDDTLINLDPLNDLLDYLISQQLTDSVIGHVLKNEEIVRDSNSKYYLPWTIYNQVNYPQFCQGPACLIPPTVISKLYHGAMNENVQPKLRIDDAFFYGIVREALEIKIFDLITAKFCWYCDGQQSAMIYKSGRIVIGELRPEAIKNAWRLISAGAN